MPRSGPARTVFLALLLTAAASSDATAAPRRGKTYTALDRYVAKPDPAYRYTLVRTQKADGVTAYVLDMISQDWRAPGEVDRTRWQHWVTVCMPDEVRNSTGFLYITGGSNGGQPPASPDPFMTRLAAETHSVVTELRMVPNEPLTFPGELFPRTEDAIIAYSWDKFLKTGDESWPLRLPMTKSAVRAMDTVTSFCGDPARGRVKVDKFVVSGGSKRGWTTWTTGAVDDRVVAIAPFVIDVLNVRESMDHHFRSYGFWAPAVGDYTAMKLQQAGGSERYRQLMEIEDPYSYRDRLTMPKLIVNSTGDQYFLPDSWQFYWKDLKGEKHLRYVPNTKHSLSGNNDARETLLAFYQAVLAGKQRPRYSWKVRKDGSIRVKTRDAPTEVRLWQATNPKARDFRLDTIGPAYSSAPLAPEKPGVYVGRVSPPAQGWTAFFVELTFGGPGAAPYRLTTGVHVVPDTLPFPAPPTAPEPVAAAAAPSLNSPECVRVPEARGEQARDEELCVGRNGEFCAYPLRMMAYHRVVNDHLGGPPILVSYDPQSRVGRVFDPALDGKSYNFDAVPARGGRPRLKDRETGSTWSAVTGEAVEGPLKGRKLALIPSSIFTWEAWKAEHPTSWVLAEDPKLSPHYTARTRRANR